MDNELEQKRKEKVEGFKISFGDLDAIPDEPENADDGTEQDRDDDIRSGENKFKTGLHDIPAPAEDLTSFSETSNDSSEQVLDKDELRAAKRLDRKRSRRKGRKNRVIFRTIWFVMIIFVSIIIGEFLMVGVNDMLAVGREEENEVTVTIPKNATLDQVTDILKSKKVISNEGFFKAYATITRATSGFTNGTFNIKTNKDYQAIINYMQSEMNRTDVVTIQFPEGYTINDFAKLLEKNKVCSAEDFIKYTNSTALDEDYTFLTGITNPGERYFRMEGYMFPDTYDFYVNESPESVARKFLSNYRRKLYLTRQRFEKNEKKITIENRAKATNMSMEEVLTMASLIQAEAANTDDMYIISSIIHNRLATAETNGVNPRGETGFMFLQLDSTEFYPYRSKSEVPQNLRATYTSTYSTYSKEGLPPGPICNPSLDAIKAALNPADTDYYYFCHKPASDGQQAVPYYAKTNAEHVANQKKAGLL